MENGLVTSDGTKVLTVEEYDKFLLAIPEAMKQIFEVNTITGMRYIEIQRLYENPSWYSKERNQIILPKEAQKRLSRNKLKGPSTNCLPLFRIYLNSSAKERNRLIVLRGIKI